MKKKKYIKIFLKVILAVVIGSISYFIYYFWDEICESTGLDGGKRARARRQKEIEERLNESIEKVVGLINTIDEVTGYAADRRRRFAEEAEQHRIHNPPRTRPYDTWVREQDRKEREAMRRAFNKKQEEERLEKEKRDKRRGLWESIFGEIKKDYDLDKELDDYLKNEWSKMHGQEYRSPEDLKREYKEQFNEDFDEMINEYMNRQKKTRTGNKK